VADVKTTGSKENEFGYMSDHYIVKLGKECSGPRYDEIKQLKCEIQVRTILMDAWDSVSHHLDYKQEIDIPSQFRRDFYALSGLFYVADSHFEILRDSITKLWEKLDENMNKGQFDLSQEMNYDTLRAYLRWSLPDRISSENSQYSELLAELKERGYSQFRRLNEVLTENMLFFETEESLSGLGRFVDVVVVRIILSYLRNYS